MKYKSFLTYLGPGLLLAGTAIGASHLVLSTRAGAHHGFIFLAIIGVVMLLKYPFYSYAPKYTALTGKSLVQAYLDQGQWAFWLFFAIISGQMLFMVSAVGAICMGLIMVILKLPFHPNVVLVCFMLLITIILIFGKYRLLKKTMLYLSILLVLTIVVVLCFVLVKGPMHTVYVMDFKSLWKGSGTIVLVSLLGWMPSGMEATVMHSMWILENEKNKATKSIPTENYRMYLTDFKVGYILTGVLALIFVTIGTFALFGSGNTIEGNTLIFTEKLLQVFTRYLGDWSFVFMAIIAFGTMCGTLLTLWDALTRCFLECLVIYKAQKKTTLDRQSFLNKGYKIVVPILGLGGAAAFILFKDGVIKILEFITITSFLMGPIIGFLNWRAMQSKAIPRIYRTSTKENLFAFTSIFCLFLVGLYYLVYR